MFAVFPSVDGAEGNLELSRQLLLGDVASLTDLAHEGSEVNRCLRRRSQPSSASQFAQVMSSCTRSYSASYMKAGPVGVNSVPGAAPGGTIGVPRAKAGVKFGGADRRAC